MQDSSERLVLLYSRDQIPRRVRELAARISADYAGRDLILVGILRGAFVFLADLIRQLTVPVAIDFVGAASYGSRAQSSGQVAITRALQVPVSGRDVLLVEDIEDTGITLRAIQKTTPGARASFHQSLHYRRQARTAAGSGAGRLHRFHDRQGFYRRLRHRLRRRYRYLPDLYRVEGLDKASE